MPPDIRSFFAPKGSQGGSSQKSNAAPTPAAKKKAGPARKRRVVVDSDDDDDDEQETPPPPPTKKENIPKKSAAKAVEKEEKIEPTTALSYFSSNGKAKPKRTAPVKAPRKKAVKVQLEENFLDDDEDFGKDIFAAEYKKEEEYKEDPHDDDEEEEEDDFVALEDEDVKPKKKAKMAVGRKRKTVSSDDEEDEEPPKKSTKAKATATPKKPATTRKPRGPAKKKEEPKEDPLQAIFDSVPTIRPPTPPPQEEGAEPKKFNFRDFKQRGAPVAQGTKELPVGEENCLTGLTFVFTGVLESLSREDGQQLVKRHGGKVTSAPSKKTSFVVLGSDAGPKKIETIKQNDIKTINEDGLFHLIRTLPANGGDGNAAKINEAKKAAEQTKIREMAKEMDKVSKSKGKNAMLKEASELWTVKYAPTLMNQICGNKGQVEKLQSWLKNWQKNLKVGFKNRGADGAGVYRAVMIHGPPGIGKTTAAHLVAKLEGYDIVESNASDTRSKKLMEESLRGVLDNKSLMGYFASNKEKVETRKQKLVLIMDEVDGMSAGDRGGVGQLAAVCRKSSIPIICICNERKLPKMKPFDHVTLDLAFRRPDANSVRSRIMSIAFREGLKLPANVIDQLVEGTHSDIRQIINMLSTYTTTQSTMSFDQGKDMAKAWEKHIVLKPWDIAQKLLGPEMFAPQSKKTLNDKIELYFNDHEFSYLMIQDNYLKTKPARASSYSGREHNLKLLELTDNAAQSISDGDLVDALIHGPQQQWSLMPVHGMFSTVKPCSYIYGGYAGHQFSFTQWLGMNSKYGKLSRFVKEIQSHMRLRSSGDRHEIRQSYIPTFFNLLVKRLEVEGKDSIPDIIELMDGYFLTKDDWDAILELGVGPMNGDKISIPTQVKTSFTRQYNQISHPLPFMKSSSIVAPRASKKDIPDLEDVIVESEDEGPAADEQQQQQLEEQQADELDLSKDKYVKQPKKKAVPKKAAAAGAAGTTKARAKGKAKAKK